MLWSKSYIPTLREDPAEAEITSHRLLVRGGFIRKLASGVYIYLPMMQRVLTKIARIVREEMNAAGAQEITMPVLHPAEVWQESGRWATVGKELFRLKDRHSRDMILGPTHEEVVTYLARGEVRSYRQLPLNLYQIQVKFRDEIRPRFGLMRCREFMMKDAYSFDADEESFKIAYQKMIDAYKKIFPRCGLETKIVESDTGTMGGKAAHEFIVPVETASGEVVIFWCDKCGYSANQDKARSYEATSKKEKPIQKPMEKISTPNLKTVTEVTNFLNVSPKQLVKTLLYLADDKVVAALIRGDRELNEIKLRNATGAVELEMADAQTVQKATGANVGFTGPVGLKNAVVIADEEVAEMVNLVSGANQNDTHLININPSRDFKPDKVAEIHNAVAGELCPNCKKGELASSYGIEVGNTFMLGTKYSESMGAKFIDQDRQEKPFIMGSYGIGITRTAQSAVEKFNDADGIIWPVAIAPFAVAVVPVDLKVESQRQAAEEVYGKLSALGVEVILDDRDERAGVKFKDCDLVGFPVKLVIGDKGLKDNKIEFQIRKNKEKRLVDRALVAEECIKVLAGL
ncbi:MAG: proline--tRNA ligase [candidate division Zixibacteria bacterium]|nr:proline--tRNA ligase [candidate division Zixibacteria bacterium]